MTDAPPLVTVVVMAFNEALNLPVTCREIHAVLTGLGQSFDLLIVDDGSSDATGTLADKLADELPAVRVIHHGVNRGLGGVYRTGFAEARGTYLTFFPADGQFPATIIPEFLQLIPACDLVLGHLPRRDDPLLARFLSRMERLCYRLLFGTLPRFQGVLMIRRTILAQLPLRSTGRSWVVLMELILRAARQGYRIRGAPTAVRPRLSGTSKVNNLRTIFAHLRELYLLSRLL
jgi:glycosyltransferase involved in cell wall biosynthesis